jgi:4-diphosphocytidyl-2-C-methyl-D-erythritol kinase
MNAAGWPAPAKINLFLHVTGRRPDGYHLLQTLFQFVDHGDTLHFRLREDGAIRRLNGTGRRAPQQDLVVRAARKLKDAAGCALGADIPSTSACPWAVAWAAAAPTRRPCWSP